MALLYIKVVTCKIQRGGWIMAKKIRINDKKGKNKVKKKIKPNKPKEKKKEKCMIIMK